MESGRQRKGREKEGEAVGMGKWNGEFEEKG